MKLRLLMQYQGWAPGTVVNFVPGVCDMLLHRKIAERIEDEAPTLPPEPIAERPPRNTAASRERVRRKGT